MKVLVDTNVLVAAYATRGLCSDFLRLILAQHELVVSQQVLAELERALRDKIGLPQVLLAEILATLTPQLCDGGGAEALVTGDADRLTAAAETPIPILSPRAFWLQQRGG